MSFIQPGRSDVHVDRPLTNISVAFIQSAEGFVADRVFPALPVSKQTDSYFTYDRGYFNRAEMKKRAPATESAGMNYAISTDTYRADVWALHKDIPDQVRANADDPISLDSEATTALTLQGLLRKEKEWAANYFVTGVWTNEEDGVTGSPSSGEFQFFDEAASTPIETIRRWKRTVQVSTGGFRPNIAVMGRAVFDALLDHPDIVGRLDRGQTTGPAMVMVDALAALFELDEILVMDAVENTANEGAANSHAFIGGKNILLAYRPQNPGLMTPSAGYTMQWTGLMGGADAQISMLRNDFTKSDRVEIEMAFDQKLVSADLGFFGLGAVS